MSIAFCLAMLAFLISAILSTATAQPCRCLNGGYTASVYPNQVVASNVQYTQNASAEFDGSMLHCKMDIWGPVGDNCYRRPAIIWVHGGGFAQMDKSAPDVVAMCDSFSRKGFICATIDYRDDYWGTMGPVNENSMNPTPYDVHEFTRADYRAMQDAKCAVRYLKANAAQYGIDTNYIFMGGTSAGAWTSLMVAYLDKVSEKPASCNQQSSVAGMYQRPDLGSIDGNGGWSNVSSRVAGIISCWGAMPDTSFIDGPNDPAAIIFHEYNDPVVNYYYGPPFQGAYQNFSSYWGTHYINMQMNNKNVTHKTFPINGSQHSLYPYRGLVTSETSKFLDSLICTSTTTGSDEIPNLVSILQVYPNPSAGVFQLEALNKFETVAVYNATGGLVYSETVNPQSGTLDLSGRPNGIYLIKVNSGGNILTQKVLISR